LVRIARASETTVAALVGEEGGPSEAAYGDLTTPGAFDLLRAYANIPDADVRRAILGLTRRVAMSAGRAEAA
jgi:hypothetical protein